MDKSNKLPIRINVNGAIIKDDKILLIEFKDENGTHYNLPGGGLELGETTNEGVKRECFEEAGIKVEVDKLLMVWEYVPEKENFKYGTRQKIGLIFLCHQQSGTTLSPPTVPDENQVGVRWIPIKELANLYMPNAPLYPTVGKQLLQALESQTTLQQVWNDVKV